MTDRLADAGITVSMVDALTEVFPGVPSPSELDPALRAALGVAVVEAPARSMGLRAAAALGARSVNVTHYLGVPTPFGALTDALAAVSREAAGLGLLVCVEFIPKTSIPDITTAQRLVEASGARNARVLLDTWHHARGGGTLDDVRALPAGSIGAVQLSDRVAPEDRPAGSVFAGRRLPGDGSLPLVDIVAAALSNSPELTIDVEVSNTDFAAMTTDEIVAEAARAATEWSAVYDDG
jgi:sugar phosphate isomerase/epimerase